MNTLATVLAAHKARLTHPRSEVFRVLMAAQEPLSIHDIVIAAQALDRSSIYRTLELFETLSIITVVHVGWKKRYELAGIYQKYHHHHLLCTSCERSIDIHSRELETVITRLSASYAFTPTGHTFEITGTCRKCKHST